jgi:PEP-CTERM motif
MKMSMLFAASLLAAVSGAQALTIDFGQTGSPIICTNSQDGLGALASCGNGSPISQSYGDVAGISDITYSSPRITTPQSLLWWASSYNNLYGVAWSTGSDANSRARIEIKALQPGQAVTISSFDLGAYPSVTRNTNINIYAIGGTTPLFSLSNMPVGNSSVSATTFTPNITVADGLWIEWADSAYNVGIDNIQYSVTVVPEPASALLMLAGVAGLFAARRRG